ncbi:MAG: ABC transporter permease [Candidatus Eisenbacteria bacterium]|uniref:ABC transporter permease n=1 Tax=Eiseniibacteriota bacterium TaxID=2212470 RepID=A0A849SM71_UNCEI|nr:ABC transporter permease [Candidatus Eisenbacteria bacterium]
MDTFLQDLRIGWRGLARTPGFTAVVVLVMALGIGANSMVFGITNSLLFRKTQYFDEQRSVSLYRTIPKQNERRSEWSMPDFRDVRERVKSYEAIGGFTGWQAYVTLGREPERFEAALVSPGLMRVFQAPPVLGREFTTLEEEKSRALGVVMISERMWRERFNSDTAVLGRTLKVNGRVREIVGVAAVNFRYPDNSDFFVPLYYDPTEDSREADYIDIVARLKPGVTIPQANAEIEAIAADLSKQYPRPDAVLSARVASFREEFVDDVGPMLAVLMAAVGFVLLIACANVANLLLARGAGRQREIALRFALGATRGRIVRQLLTESIIVSLLGGLFGILLAVWGRDLVLSSIPLPLPFWMDFSTDPNTLLFTIGASMLAALLAGLAPALQTSQVDVHEALKEGGLHGTSGRGRSRLRSTLVVAEIALALVLLTGSGLMIRSFLNMANQRSSVKTEGLMTGRFTMPIAVYASQESKLAFTDGLMQQMRALPGVEAVSAIQALPLSRNAWNRNFRLDGDATGPDAPRRVTYYSIVRPEYFKTMGIEMTTGRDFTALDDSTTQKVAIVSETAARTLWPGKDPIGQRFNWGAEDTTGWKTVIGVVSDVYQHIEGKRPPVTIYVPHMQDPQQTLTLVVKHTNPPGAMIGAMRRTLLARDGDMPLYETRTMDESVTFALWENRLWASLMSVFATLALVIAAIGIYGVMAYSVAQRTQEIGIRMALGAVRKDVMGMVLGQALKLTLIGVGIGLAGAYGMTRLMASVLFGVSPNDPPTFVGVTLILAFSALLAAWVPADRATRVDPMVALRSE